MSDPGEPVFEEIWDEFAQASFAPFEDTNPAFCALRWSLCIRDVDANLAELRARTVPGRESALGADWKQLSEGLSGWALTSGVETIPGRPHVRTMKLIRNPGVASYVMEGGPVRAVTLVLMQGPDSVWRVWSLSARDFP